MKHVKIIQSLILCVLSFGAIIQAEINQPQETAQPQEMNLTASQQAEIMKIIEFAEKALIQAFSNLQKIENILTEVALLVRKGSLNIPAAKLHEIMELLTENKMTVNALLSGQAEIVATQDPRAYLQYASLITEFCNAFTTYLNDHIKNGFKDAQPFNLKRFVANMNKGKTRSNGQHLKPESLKIALKKTRTELTALTHSVKNIGLTWYNKVARSVDKYVVTPANKYHVPTIVGYGAGLTLFSLYTLWSYGHLFKDYQMHQETKDEDGNITCKQDNPAWLQTVQTFVKDTLYADNRGPIVRNGATGRYEIAKAGTVLSKVENANPYSALTQHEQNPYETKLPTDASLLATVDFTIKDFMLQSQPLGALAAAYLFGSLYKTWSEEVYPKIVRRRDDTWNFLRGGEYRSIQKAGLAQIKPTYTFRDMVGLDKVKEQFSQIIQYIDDPEQFMRIGGAPEKGWLLTGPTRTGKSFSVECLCGEIDLLMKKRGKGDIIKCFNIDSFMINKWGIKEIIEQVNANAPAVIFIDEIDLLGLQRVGNNALLSEFLVAMQSSMNPDPSKVVIIIAATNNPENLDKALRQPGRFGEEIRFEYPAREDRLKFIKHELANMAVDFSQFDLETLADKTDQKSFEALKKIIRNAMTSSMLHGESLSQQLLEHSIDTAIHHIITSERKTLPEHETRIIATHFAGRALAIAHLETHTQLDKVTIHARMTELKDELVWDTLSKKDEKDQQQKIEYGFISTKQPHDSINVKKETTIINEATALIAGFAAEELLLGSCGFTCHSKNRDRAFKLIEDLVFGGLNPTSLPKDIDQELRRKAYNTLQQCHVDAMKLLQEHKDALIALVDELMTKKIMTDKEVQTVIDKAEGRTTVNTDTNLTPSEDTPAEVVV